MEKADFDELINNINDKIFKSTFQQKESAIEYLQTFVSAVADRIDLENLTLGDTKFCVQ